MMPKRKKKPYFPNNWEAIKDAPSECFLPLPYDEFMDWKIGGWELPSSVHAVIREENLLTGKITEHVYSRQGHAENKVRAIMARGESEFIVANHEAVHVLTPKFEEDYDDPLA